MDASTLLSIRSGLLERSAALRAAATVQPPEQKGFAAMLSQANQAQAAAGDISAAFERGQETDIAKVMLSRQTASVAFEATLQVRNKLLSAYRDIMNMPV